MKHRSRVGVALAALFLLLSVGWPRRGRWAEETPDAVRRAARLVEERFALRPQDRFGLGGPAARAAAELDAFARFADAVPPRAGTLEEAVRWGMNAAEGEPVAVRPRLPLRAPEALGENGLRALAASGRNAALLDEGVLRALGVLVGTVEAVARGPRRTVEGTGLLEIARATDGLFRSLRAVAPREDWVEVPAGRSLPRGLLFLGECDAGWIVVGGPGSTLLPVAECAIAVDLGGDDRWLLDTGFLGPPARRPAVRILLDLSGRDVYRSERRLDPGTLLLVADGRGDDRYEGRGEGWEAAEGALLLRDEQGDDRYDVEKGLGAGPGGRFLLVDEGGDDRYTARASGIATSSSGRAVLLDRGGDDLYVSVGEAGRGPVWSRAGFSALLDLSGNDVYRSSSWALAAAEEEGRAFLFDRAGDDLYRIVDRGLGFAVGGSLAALFDLGGNDETLAGPSALAAGSGATAVAWFEGGIDRFAGAALAGGDVSEGGLRLFVREAGEGGAWGSLPATRVPGGIR